MTSKLRLRLKIKTVSDIASTESPITKNFPEPLESRELNDKLMTKYPKELDQTNITPEKNSRSDTIKQNDFAPKFTEINVVTDIPGYLKIPGLPEPVGLTESTVSIEPIKPTDSTEPIEPVELTQSTEPIGLTGSIEPIKPTDSIEPIEPIEPTEPTKPVRPTQSTEPTKRMTNNPEKISNDLNCQMSPTPPIQIRFSQCHSDIDQTIIETNMAKIRYFQTLPHYEQKSKEWLDQRNNYLTASTIASALGLSGPMARHNLLLNKVSNGQINQFSGNSATHWGNKYEPVANAIYTFRNHVRIYDFGMITNPKYPILGISPDGITQYRMIEIKCPPLRIIDGKIKTEYYHQMQEQMAVCEFDQCDFLECRFEEVPENVFWDDFEYYNASDNINHEKGIIIAYICIKTKEIRYLYSPIEAHLNRQKMKEWETQTIQQLLQNPNTLYLNQFYWYLTKYNCQLVNRDPQWIVANYPILINFWKEVEYYRKVGIQTLIDQSRIPKSSSTTQMSLSVKHQSSKHRCLL